LCEQVEQAASMPAADRLAARAKIREWHGGFDGLGELPRPDARGLRDRFQRAIARYEEGLARQDLRDTEAVESNLIEAARHIRAYERAVMLSAPPAELETLRNAAEGFIAGVQRWPKGGPQALKQALTRADSASGADEEARERTLRMLCIRCEILGSTPTPPEDQALRRDYQMRLLMERMGQPVLADDREWDALLLEWIAVGSVAPEVHEDLQSRFMRSLAKRPVKARRDERSRSDTVARR
jgi:hypothetical protein